ncbi:purine-cytosine permease family protein [Desmospora activa]|uniref:Cytosine permease n=1 Tax=Desmospora activa DSM 45169 TaxID=1121389 RepID=A0A2T4Z1R9_9BACL|nr:cytosine permease [Desmospora activa]PTM54714.1 cytosine permease [Desmospora activa DSM 45169]
MREFGTGFFVKDDYARQPIPIPERRAWLLIALVWIGMGTDLVGASLGVYLSTGMTVKDAITSILISNIIMGVIGGLVSYIGGATGLSTAMISRFVFGEIGSRILSYSLFFMLLGFFAIQAGLFGESASYLILSLTGTEVSDQWLAVIGALLMTLTATLGFIVIERLSSIAVPLMLFLLGGLIGKISAHSPEHWFLVEPNTGITITMGSAISMVVGSWIGMCVISPDIARWARTKKTAFLSGFVGLFIGNSMMMSAAVIMSRITGADNVIQVMVGVGWGAWAVVILILAQWTTNDNNLYSGGLSMSNIFRSVPKSMLTLGIGLFGAFLTYIKLVDSLVEFVNILALVFAPVAAIYIIEYFLLNRARFLFVFIQNKKIARIYWVPMISWFTSSLVGLMTMTKEEGGLELFTLTGAAGIDAFVVAAVMHLVVGKSAQMLFNKKEEAEPIDA